MTPHLLSISQLSIDDIHHILDKAEDYIQAKQHLSSQLNELNHMTVMNLFFETSTRTRVSFELAAKRLGATVVNINLETSAMQKGESLLDTVYTLRSMHNDFFIIRHNENHVPDFIGEHVGNTTAIINAGDGTNAHPSQALLDMLSIRQHKNKFEPLSVAIIGDIVHSRVAHSDIEALLKLGCKDIRVIAPNEFQPTQKEEQYVSYIENIDEGIRDADVIIMLRIQKERMQNTIIPNQVEYKKLYGLSQEKLSLAKKDVIVMHPGPMNRGVEIDSDVADGKHSIILSQVSNGIAVRMAIIKTLAERLEQCRETA